MKPKILSRNARGLNKGVKRLKVKNLLRQSKVDIICLQETKLEFISSSIVKNLWGCPYVEWCYVASRGASGGISLMWDRRVVTKIEFLWGNLLLLVH